ncbi:hybrid sensor histidine kinase/response regulator transcription factor [Saccharicrinis fermentans]|uniref:histidine kinase n=1 Tax=Saccharicrinis fermentans DSM 9555 = JCM 21142 TaxID=869213 RepID=W7YJ66_9BACT|nr:two-component regulator propeller domain-containing protein [Saccharicrinis fermentans]GAF04536.1 sensor histidine kinase YycG [Saccharicrinis fermentans DSM 9555 = JCM 21142]
MKHCTILLLLLFVVLSIRAHSKYNFKTITMEDGLPNNSVLCIAQDSIGRMWFGTYDGLCMFDGIRYKSFNYDAKKPETSLPDNQVLALDVDKSGNLWVQLGRGIISRLVNVQKGIFKTYLNLSNGTLEVTGDGDVWVNVNGDYYCFLSERDQFVRAEKPPMEKKGSLQREYLRQRYPHVAFMGGVEVGDNEFWCGSRYKGLFHVVKKHDAGNFYVEHIRHHKDNPFSIASDEAYCSFVDNVGILWVGTKDRGLSKLLPQLSYIQTLSFRQGNRHQLPESPIRAMANDDKNSLWVGTYDKGVFIYNKEEDSFEKVVVKRQFNNDWERIRCIYKSKDGSMWIGSYAGLLKVDINGRQSYFNAEASGQYKLSRIYSMVEDEQGFLWLGGWGGLDKINIRTGAITHVLSTELSDIHIRNLYLDNKKILWIATEFGGINKYNLTTGQIEIIKNTDQQSPLSCNSLFHIIQNRKGDYWISTFSGITVYKPEEKSFEKLQLNLPSDLIYGVLQDKGGNYWINTGKGVVRYNEALTQSRVFDSRDGWVSQQMCEGGFFQSSHGTLFFGGNEGINFFQPHDFVNNEIAPKAFLGFDNQKNNAKSADGDKQINLGYFNEGLHLNIHAFHNLEPSKNKIQYRLWPSDSAWIYVQGSQAKVQRERLKPGEYELQYKMANADGKWGSLLKKKIVVKPPIWFNVYYQLAFMIFFLLGLSILLRLKVRMERYKRRKLEQLVKQRTQQLEDNQKALQKINRELAVSNQSVLEQKNKISKQHGVLLQMHEQLKEVNEMKMQFFSNLAHEFRTPLTLIAGPVEQLLADEHGTDHLLNVLRLIKTQTDVLIQLVNQLLDFKKLEGGYMTLRKESGGLISFCNNIMGGFELEADSKQIALRFISTREEINCYFDHEKIRQILVNLLSNAFKFTHKGGHIVVSLEVDDEENKVVIKVADDGIGIPEAHIQNIFQRFYQAGQSLDLTKPGTGLGLSLCQKMVELHGGNIGVESREGEGCCFIVNFPYEAYEEDKGVALNSSEYKMDQKQKQSALVEDENDNKKCVLVVDDHPDIVWHIKGILENQYMVFTAGNGLEALKLIKHRKVDLILCDWLMPQMDGVMLCEKIKENKRWQQIPFILITALSNESHQIKALQKGADDFISKPFSNRLLLTKVNNLIRREKALLEAFNISKHLQAERQKVPSLEERVSQKIALVINDHLSDANFSPDLLGEKMGWSKMQLYRKVKQATGITPNELIQQFRLQRGRQLLQDGNYRISEVCFMVGFNDPKYFSRCFQKAFRLRPSEFQLQHKQEKERATC